MRYPCPQCEHAATAAGALKIYVESKYKGVRFHCSQCEHAATAAGALKIHVESKHKGVR